MKANPRQHTTDVLKCHPYPVQTFQQPPPIPEVPESPNPENRGHSDIFRLYNLPDTILNQRLVTRPKNVKSGQRLAKYDIACAP